MSSWMNGGDGATVSANHGFLDPNTNNNTLDPSFMNGGSSFDPSQFQTPHAQRINGGAAMRNGNASPAFNLPVYQTNPVVPAKRARPREDSLGTSPRQAPGMLPNSRSQTPQQGPYPGFQPNSQPPNSQASPYSHLTNGSANATPSPIMANHQLRPGGVPQRVSTASPHPFSPAGQQFPQASPAGSEHGASRTDTPQNGNPYAQNPNFNPNYGQNFTPPPGRSTAPPQNAMVMPNMPQHMGGQPQMYPQPGQPGQPQQQQVRGNATLEQQQMLYKMRLQQQMQQQHALAAQQRGGMPPSVNTMIKGPMPGQNGQFPGVRPQQATPTRAGLTPEAFMKNLQSFMQSKNTAIDPNPMVGDRPLNLATLYMTVVKFGGFKKVTQQNGWPQVAQAMQFHPGQIPSAPVLLKGHYERNLYMFEEAWQLSQQRQRAAAMQQQNMVAPGASMSPTNQMSPQAAMQQSQNFLQQQQQLTAQQQHLQQTHSQGTPVKKMPPMQQPAINGFSTPQPPQGLPHPNAQNHSRNSQSRTVDATPPQPGPGFPMPSPISVAKLASPQVDVATRAPAPSPPKYNLPEELDPKVRILDTFGGVELESLLKVGRNLTHFKPDTPLVQDMGVIDIQALTMSLQCGLHSEVRLALDSLVSLSVEPRLNLDLRACEDLVEVLIDCAEIQVELLAESAAEVSDVMLVTSYEDVMRSCRVEQEFLQEIHEFGSPDYELDRAVDRLICITTILRNLSFTEMNHALLADELVIKFLCIVIRYLGTRNMLLRTNYNTLDFMKDVILFLSNLSQNIELPGREQALCLLHFLLAFAPSPPPSINASDRISFSAYDPAVHRYLPPAVDTLAKILARDEPNRTHYKTIFASDVASSPPYDLLTRTFALAISVIPDAKLDTKRGNLMLVVEARKAFLMQGILAAEIIANLAPGYASGVSKSWLTSEDGFSQNLIRLIFSLCLDSSPPPAPHQRGQAPPRGADDVDAIHIALGSIAVLRRLAEKSRDPEDPLSTIPISGFPSKDHLLGALSTVHPKLQVLLKQLCVYAGMNA